MGARAITHATASARSDNSDAGAIQPSHWNAGHTLTFGPSFIASRTGSTQTLANNTLSELILNNEELDTGGYYNPSNGRFTPLVAGYYQVNASVQISSDLTDINTASLFLYKNGSAYRNGTCFVTSTGTPSVVRLAIPGLLVPLNGSTDYISLFGLVIRTTGPTYLPNGASASSFEARWVQPL